MEQKIETRYYFIELLLKSDITPETLLREKPVDEKAARLVLTVLAYFDLFEHPLTADEVFERCGCSTVSKDEIEEALSDLQKKDIVKERDGFYHLRDHHALVQRRLLGEQAASLLIEKAKGYSRLISKFPFIRGVYLSGSLSKFYADKNSDIDYFIISQPNRLWLARTMLVLFKKLFLFNSKKYFCVNYFVSESTLRIPDENLFTATEIAFLVPTYNYPLFLQFLKANSWFRQYYPNFQEHGEKYLIENRQPSIKSLTEKLLNGRAGDLLDSWSFKLTLFFWKRKFGDFDNTTFDHRLRSRKNVSKHHPLGYQERVLSAFHARLASLEKTTGVRLSNS